MNQVEQLKEDVLARRIDADRLVEVLVTLEYRRFTDRLLEIYRAAGRIQRDGRLSDPGRARKVAELDVEILELCGSLWLAELRTISRSLCLRTYRKSFRGPKKPPPPKFHNKRQVHLSTAKLLVGSSWWNAKKRDIEGPGPASSATKIATKIDILDELLRTRTAISRSAVLRRGDGGAGLVVGCRSASASSSEIDRAASSR